MRIENNVNNTNPQKTFKSAGFYNATAELESNIVLSRAIIDMFGCDIPWVVMANNKDERIERARRYVIVFLLAFISPMAFLPLLNKFAMKNIVKLTKEFSSSNHKAMHLSNEYLVNTEKMTEGLKKLKPERSPFEILGDKILGKKPKEEKLDVNELIKNAGGKEQLRKKLINAKNSVIFLDFLTSGVPLGAMGFINNYLTKRSTGQAGFSAEFKMADKEIIEKRADNYEKNKNKRYAAFSALALGLPAALALTTKHGLSSQAKTSFTNFVKKHAKLMDYKSGIYMSRLLLLSLTMVSHGGLLMASRNKTEAKDTAARMGAADAIFYGGDLLLISLLANLSDRVFKTKLRKEGQKSFISKILPKTKPIKEINELVEKGKLPVKNKTIAAGVYWTNMALLALGMGYVIPTVMNKMIKKDVKQDVDKELKTDV